ncbi:MAG TPA: hypothetical protein VGP73_19885 [Thermoanaerobaculia bacterium]
MGKTILAALEMLAIPLLLFYGGAWVLTKASGRDLVVKQLSAAGQKPLSQRRSYDAAAFQNYWAVLDDSARRAEQRFLELDLLFPFVYCGGLAAGLLMAWAALGRTFNPAWLLAPVGLTLLADWTENLLQLDQLKRFLAGGAQTLQEGWIRIASAATTLKLLSFGATSVLLIGLVGILLFRAFKPA